MMRSTALVMSGALFLTTAWAAPFDVPVNPSQSVLNFELCISGSCTTDSSPVSGTVRIDLDAIASPTQITLHDFDLQLDESMHWYLSWGFLGSFTADSSGLAVHYAHPETPLGPVAVVAGGFAFANVPADSTGTVTYSAAGIPCIALQGAGLPCSATLDLANGGTQTMDQFDGQVTSQDRVVTLMTQLDMTSPLDPNNPTLATLHVYGTVQGQVYVPVPVLVGDLNCDGVVGFGDINPFVLALSNPPLYAELYPDCPLANRDIDGDGDFGFGDINPFVTLLTSGPS